MRAVGQQVIVEHLPEDPLSSIIALPDGVDKPHTRHVKATVISVGNQHYWGDDLNKGDIVLVPFHFGTRLPKTVDDKQFIVYDSSDILARVD